MPFENVSSHQHAALMHGVSIINYVCRYCISVRGKRFADDDEEVEMTELELELEMTQPEMKELELEMTEMELSQLDGMEADVNNDELFQR